MEGDAQLFEAYYKTYAAEFQWLIGPALGFTVETATQCVRMIISGVFQKSPKLKVIFWLLGSNRLMVKT